MTTSTTTGDDLAAILTDLGVEITRVGREISGRCPVHVQTVGHPDRSPSWSMNATTGLWICYSCGARGSLHHLVGQLTGDADAPLLVARFIIESTHRRLTAPTEQATKAPPRPDFDSYREFLPVPSKWLRRRRLDAEVCQAHGVRYDPADRAWIIPILSPLGDLMGWQAKKIGWFCNVPDEVPKSETLFGLERFRVGGTGVLLESPLDVVRLASVVDDVQGLASFGVHVSVVQQQLLLGYCDRVIIALDHDKAGTHEARRLYTHMVKPRKGLFFLNYAHTDAKDLGDMDDDEVIEAVQGASRIPWWHPSR